MKNNNAIAIENLRFRWPQQEKDIVRIDNFQVTAGEHLFIQGASGTGKSTLLNLLAGVVSPQTGKIELLGKDITSLSNGQKDRFRADHLGIIFQQFNLLPYLNAIENIELALSVSPQRVKNEHQFGELKDRTRKLLSNLGLDETLAKKTANQLSIGQQQRVAVARALMGKPEILIADEPTSALDSDSRDIFIEELFRATENTNTTIIFVSHDDSLKTHFHHHINLAEINKASVGASQ